MRVHYTFPKVCLPDIFIFNQSLRIAQQQAICVGHVTTVKMWNDLTVLGFQGDINIAWHT